MTTTATTTHGADGLPTAPDDLPTTLRRLSAQALDMAFYAHDLTTWAITPRESHALAALRECLGELHVELEQLHDATSTTPLRNASIEGKSA